VRSDPVLTIVRDPAPRADGHLCELPALRLAALIRSRVVSPLEVLDAHLARIEAVNPRLNALVGERFADARREAASADARVRHAPDPDDLPPLLGVPCTIKEFVGVRGLSWTAGLWARRGRRADRDATVVERLRAAGAIVLGVSNVPEGGMWMETHNPIYGRTANPWDLRRTPGGSSGGEAALVAAGASPFGIGSDIAGSIRIPSGMCGVIGHKPTALLVPNTGHWPESSGDAERMLCTGPIGRSVDDVERILELIAGPDGQSQAHRTLPPRDPALAAGDLRGVRVYPVTATARVRIAPVMRLAIERAAAALAARGATIVELDRPTWRRLFGRATGTWLRGLSELGGEQSFADLITGGERLDLLAELVRAARGRGRYAAATLGLIALERLTRFAPGLERRVLAAAPGHEEVQSGLEELLGDRGVLLHPPYSRPAPRHMWPLLTPFDAVCTALFSVTGLPGTVVPVGFDAHHLPVAVQVVGRRGADRLTLGVARALEAELGGWTPARLQCPAP
jgi:fatty acid amide hydrolase 2